MVEDSCVICGADATSSHYGTVTNVSRGIETLREVSLMRADDLHRKLVGKTTVKVHEACRKSYTKRPEKASLTQSIEPGAINKVFFCFSIF